jgi:L-fuconolactonase
MAPYLDVAFEAFGPERLMIGSDWPVCTVAASHGRAVEAVKHYLGHLSTEAQEAVLGGNAQRFWRLKLPPERR